MEKQRGGIYRGVSAPLIRAEKEKNAREHRMCSLERANAVTATMVVDRSSKGRRREGEKTLFQEEETETR